MSDIDTPALTAAGMAPPPVPPAASAPPSAQPSAPAVGNATQLRWIAAALALLLVLSLVAVVMAWRAQQRVQGIAPELVRRQQDSQSQAAEARLLAQQAAEATRDSAAKLALLEARVAEVAVQRGQLEELLQALSKSRDENLLVDIDSGIRVAMQQSAITGSGEALVAALKQADERLLRYNQPRMEGVRRALARDLDRVKAVGVADLPSLSIKLDEAVRMVDELPLLSNAEARRDSGRAAPAEARPAAAAASGAIRMPAWLQSLDDMWSAALHSVWGEVRSLVRVTRIDRPEAALMAPENAFFVRENLKLRLLNARLALLSRQYDTAQSDLQGAAVTLERYFDRGSRRTVLTLDLVRQVAANARQVNVLRPDDTLAALAALNSAVPGR